MSMWHTFLAIIYAPLMVLYVRDSETVSNSKQENITHFNSSGTNEAWKCQINNSFVYFPHSKPELRGCYKLKERGPCGESMKLYLNEESEKPVGECDCDRISLRTLIYHEETERCYPIFQQGYCQAGMWLDLNREGKAVCENNPCYENSSENTQDLVLMNGTCVQAGSMSSLCSPREIVGFKQLKRSPTCIPRAQTRAIGAIPIKCRPGTYRALNGRCQPGFVYDFD